MMRALRNALFASAVLLSTASSCLALSEGKAVTSLLRRIVSDFRDQIRYLSMRCERADALILEAHEQIDREVRRDAIEATVKPLSELVKDIRGGGRRLSGLYLNFLHAKVPVLVKAPENQDTVRKLYGAVSHAFVESQRLFAEVEGNLARLRWRLRVVGLEGLVPDLPRYKVHIPKIRKATDRALYTDAVETGAGDLLFLVIGTDTILHRGRSDVILVVRVPADGSRVRILSVPRDTAVELLVRDHFIEDKINHAFARDGIMGTQKAIRDLLGLDVRNHVLVDYHLFQFLVDAVGGVPVTVAKAMRYEDKAGGLKIDIPPGPQVLTGDKAIGYVRFRADGHGDIGRIQRQQRFLRAFLTRARSPRRLVALAAAAPGLSKYLSFELPLLSVIRTLATRLRTLSLPDVKMKVLPGKSRLLPSALYGGRRLCYFVTDPTEVRKVVREWFLELPPEPEKPSVAQGHEVAAAPAKP